MKRAFVQKPSLFISKDVFRLPAEKIIADDKALVGYIQEEIYTVLSEGDSHEAHIHFVYDADWVRRGFVTDNDAAYLYDADGKPVEVPETDFPAIVKVILRTTGVAKIDFQPFVVDKNGNEVRKKAERGERGGKGGSS